MSIAASPIAAAALAEAVGPPTKLPPQSRTIVPRPDSRATPEAR